MDSKYLEIVAGLSIGYAAYEQIQGFRFAQARRANLRTQSARAIASLLFMAYWGASVFVPNPLLRQAPALLGLTLLGLGSAFLNRWARISGIRSLRDGDPASVASPTSVGARVPNGEAPGDP